jgi:dTMP kinase
VLRLAIEGRVALDPTTLALAFAADRSDHLAHGIAPQVDDGAWVLCDRYVLSSLAYQSGAGVSLDFVRAINAFAVEPDLTIFVDTPVDVCLSRIAARSGRDELFHNRGALEATLAAYRSLLESVPNPLVVDGAGTPDEVADAIWAGVQSRFRHMSA